MRNEGGRAEADTGARGAAIVLVLPSRASPSTAPSARALRDARDGDCGGAGVGHRDPSGRGAGGKGPNIVDRNGEVLATDLRHGIALRRAAPHRERRRGGGEKLIRVLPELDPRDLARTGFSNDRGFVWLKREISGPRERAAVHDLGIPGVGFITETRRFYPGALPRSATSYEHVNVDNAGIAGMEKANRRRGARGAPGGGPCPQGSRSSSLVRCRWTFESSTPCRPSSPAPSSAYQAKAAVGISRRAHLRRWSRWSPCRTYDPNDPKQSFDRVIAHEPRRHRPSFPNS